MVNIHMKRAQLIHQVSMQDHCIRMADVNKVYGITSSVRAGMEHLECSPTSVDSVTWYKMAEKLSGSFY